MSDSQRRFEELMDAHGAGLRRVVRSYARPGSDEDDLAQEVALAIWRALPTFRGECSERSFVFRVAHFRGVSHLGRRLSRAETEEQDVVDHAPGPEQRAADREEVERLFSSLRRLPVPQRQVITLALEGMSHKEIGECLSTSTENVAVRLNRAREALRRRMEGRP